MWTTENIANESDVEQKFLYPFLIESPPMGLGYPPSVIQTKTNIRRLPIGKGQERKRYFPDYLIVALGYPLVVMEAKHPEESVEIGYREARLYATELNSLYSHGLSPIQLVMACNGVELWYGHVDTSLPAGTASCNSLGAYSKAIAELIDVASWKKTQALAQDFARKHRPARFYKPRRMLGGTGFQNEEIGINSFGAGLTATVAPIFNPTTREDRAKVARNAYVPSKRRERYVDPIDRVIRAARPPSETHAQLLENSENPDELIKRLESLHSLEHKILLLIGGVGAGKSTFIDHLIEVALPKELVATTVWCRLNMNAAPVNSGEIYKWLRREITQGCKESLSDIDFDDLDTLKKVYGIELQQFRKGVGRLYESNEEQYNFKLGEYLERIQENPDVVTNAHVRFTCAQRGKLLIVVLDNCDKKTRDEQLLMFDAAHWIQNELRCLVILPLRDETYDIHRNQPPLDTALKDLVFRIEPPLFQHLLMARVQYALRDVLAEGEAKLSFNLPNGFHVEYPRSDQAYYLTSILKSLFEHDRFARRMIVGLAGRNMRRALEIFLEVCSSAYIGEDQIFRIRQSEGNYTLPFHQIATVLIRMNRRFYDSDHSYVKNVFAATTDDAFPSFFCRYMILQWLRRKFRTTGTGGLKGYYRKTEIKHALTPYGIDTDTLDREFNYLLGAQCIIAEHLRLDSVDDEDLVRLGPAGFVHLELVGNVNYLAAIAEDTWFGKKSQASKVADRIKDPKSHLHLSTVFSNAKDTVNYLQEVRAKLPKATSAFLEDMSDSLTNLDDAVDAIHKIKSAKSDDAWFGAQSRIENGTIFQGTVRNKVAYGCFIEFEPGLVGLAHESNNSIDGFFPGDRVEVEVLWINEIARRAGLKIGELVGEDMGDPLEGTNWDYHS